MTTAQPPSMSQASRSVPFLRCPGTRRETGATPSPCRAPNTPQAGRQEVAACPSPCCCPPSRDPTCCTAWQAAWCTCCTIRAARTVLQPRNGTQRAQHSAAAMLVTSNRCNEGQQVADRRNVQSTLHHINSNASTAKLPTTLIPSRNSSPTLNPRSWETKGNPPALPKDRSTRH
jgi:hypothetical protein